MKKLLLIIAIGISGQVLAQDSLMYYYNKSTEAYKVKDYPSFMTALEKANGLRPNHPTLVYNLAAAYSLNNNQEKAIETLKQLILMNSKTSIEGDSDFISLTNNPNLADLIQLRKSLEEPVQNSKLYIEIETQDIHPEGMAYDSQTKDFYFGGVNKRNVVKYSQDGSITELINFKTDADIFSVMGIEYDQKNKVLWACTGSLPEMMDYNDSLKGHSSILALDKDGNILKKYVFKGNHMFGDLKILVDGTVLISDTGENKIYKTTLNTEPELWFDLSEKVWNLQGLAMTEQEEYLYLSDYISGLYRINLKNKEVEKVKLPKTMSDKGFDGIYFYNNQLIGIQNGVSPNKTWALQLDQSGLDVVNARVIDQALDILDEPTQGILLANRFLYIANSPWAHYKEGQFDNSNLAKTAILEYTID
jgi:tetratricopeptide (TPR) repeat protein